MQNINVNIVPDSYPQTIRYSQGDVGREFKINVVGFTIPTGATVKIQATKPSGFGFSVAGTVDGNAVSFTTTAIMTDEAGRFPAELEITKDSVVIGTANFIMWGEANPHPEGTTDGQQGTIIPELTLLVERVEAAASSILDMEVVANTLPAGSQATYSYDEDLNKATFGIPQGEAGAGAAGVVASAYSASATYKVGDYVIHNSNLYRCTIAITTAEAFTAAHWTQIVLADDVSDLKTDFNNTTYLAPITLEKCQTGNYIPNTSPKDVLAPSGASGTYNGKFVWDKCNSGDVYVVNLTALSGIYPWVICDKDGVVLYHGTQSQGETNKKIVIPSDGAYFGANCYGADDSVVKTQGLPYYNKDSANIVKKDVPFKFVHKYFNTTSPFDVDNVGVYSASYQGGIIWDKCKKGDVYILENVHMTISIGYIITICDEDGNIIAHALQAGNTHDIDYVNFYVEIPEDGAYIGIQCNNTTSKVSKLVPIDEELDTIKENIFKGLKGVAFGTSLTARADSSGTYGYLSTLRNELECEIDNQGVGGSYWFLVDYTNSSVRYVVQNYANYADKDFAIIEGCINDWFTGKILGNYTDTSGQSVCADLYAMINHIYTQNPKIQIFVILDHQGRNYNDNDCSPSAVVNSKTQYEYYTELKKLCELYSIPVISEFAESNIGVFGTEYLADNIHCNELGAEQSGQFIARKMKQIGLKVHN